MSSLCSILSGVDADDDGINEDYAVNAENGGNDNDGISRTPSANSATAAATAAAASATLLLLG